MHADGVSFELLERNDTDWSLFTCYCHTSGGLGAKVVRNDSLAKFLSQGRQRREQEDRSILPQRTEAERREFRQAIGTQLNR